MILKIDPMPWEQWAAQDPNGKGRLGCIKDLDSVLPKWTLQARADLTAGALTEIPDNLWGKVKVVLKKYGVQYKVEGTAPWMDPLTWLQRVGGGIDTDQGSRRNSNMRKPARVYWVVADGLMSKWQGPKKRTPYLAIIRAMATYPYGPQQKEI